LQLLDFQLLKSSNFCALKIDKFRIILMEYYNLPWPCR